MVREIHPSPNSAQPPNAQPEQRSEPLVIDCDTCQVRGAACADCVVSVLLGAPPAPVWDDDERRAIDALVDGGLVPRLRLVPAPSPPSAAPTSPPGSPSSPAGPSGAPSPSGHRPRWAG